MATHRKPPLEQRQGLQVFFFVDSETNQVRYTCHANCLDWATRLFAGQCQSVLPDGSADLSGTLVYTGFVPGLQITRLI